MLSIPLSRGGRAKEQLSLTPKLAPVVSGRAESRFAMGTKGGASICGGAETERSLER